MVGVELGPGLGLDLGLGRELEAQEEELTMTIQDVKERLMKMVRVQKKTKKKKTNDVLLDLAHERAGSRFVTVIAWPAVDVHSMLARIPIVT